MLKDSVKVMHLKKNEEAALLPYQDWQTNEVDWKRYYFFRLIWSSIIHEFQVVLDAGSFTVKLSWSCWKPFLRKKKLTAYLVYDALQCLDSNIHYVQASFGTVSYDYEQYNDHSTEEDDNTNDVEDTSTRNTNKRKLSREDVKPAKRYKPKSMWQLCAHCNWTMNGLLIYCSVVRLADLLDDVTLFGRAHLLNFRVRSWSKVSIFMYLRRLI
jgi:hypothetical protein